MKPANEVVVTLRGAHPPGEIQLRISTLPRASDAKSPTLWHASDSTSAADLEAAVEVLEGQEYRYEWIGVGSYADPLNTDPAELFQPDTWDGRAGRLRPRLATGIVHVSVRSGNQTLGQTDIEVRSRKLSYRAEYRWMLRDIAARMTELVMERFAASEATFVADETRDAVTLYQRFAFLQSLLRSDSLQLAVAEVLRRPHTAWRTWGDWMKPGAGLRASSNIIRQLSRSGPRVSWEGVTPPTLPARIEQHRTEATHDTPPNRFLKFAFEHWRQLLNDIDHGLSQSDASAPVERGRREVAQAIAELDEVLHHELFLTVGPLTRFPADDQVLHKREGYRDIFKAYVEFELAARLSWNHDANAYTAGQRDVATLYEQWAFIQLAEVIGKIVGQSFDMTALLTARTGTFNVMLRGGIETVLRGEVERHGRHMVVELFFNRTYGSSGIGAGSWTRPMRPDFSLQISPADTEYAAFEPVLLHFDAKYRVDFVEQLFGGSERVDDLSESDGAETEGLVRGGARRDDLLKMHSYRDAIRRTAGAYVLYPGGDAELSRRPFSEYHELLPGLGAFVLRPTDKSMASGTVPLQRFLDEVLDHVATRLTDHERSRYWLREVYGQPPSRGDAVPGAPPSETSVLVGYVKGEAHWSWITRRKAYNVRTEHRPGGVAYNDVMLQSQLLLMYCPETGKVALARIVSEAERVTKHAMRATGYPEPSSEYWCVQISLLDRKRWTVNLSAARIDEHVQSLGVSRGAPVRLTWEAVEQLCLD